MVNILMLLLINMLGFLIGQSTKKRVAKKGVAKKGVAKKGTKKVLKKTTVKKTTVKKTTVKKGISNSKSVVCGSIKNRPACLRLNRKCKYSMKTKRCQRR